MEGVQRHLRRRLSDTLRREETDGLTRLHERAHVAHTRELHERLLRHLVRGDGRGRLGVGTALAGNEALLVRLDVVVQLAHVRLRHGAEVAARAEDAHRRLVLARLLQRLLRVLDRLVHDHLALDALGVVARHHRVVVARGKVELLQVLRLGHVDRVLTVKELQHGRVRVTNSVVVVHLDTLEVLDQTALQVSGTGSLDGSVNETFTTGHAGCQLVAGAVQLTNGSSTLGDEYPSGNGSRRNHRHAPGCRTP